MRKRLLIAWIVVAVLLGGAWVFRSYIGFALLMWRLQPDDADVVPASDMTEASTRAPPAPTATTSATTASST